MNNEDKIASIKQRILDEYKKHKNLDWAEIAARKIHYTYKTREYIPKTDRQYEYMELLNSVLQSISDEFERVMWNLGQQYDNPFENSGGKWKCDEFEVEAYDWSNEINQPYNFKWRDIEISWYKYLGRDMHINKYITPEEINDLLIDCLEALRNYERINGDIY